MPTVSAHEKWSAHYLLASELSLQEPWSPLVGCWSIPWRTDRWPVIAKRVEAHQRGAAALDKDVSAY
jgi:hypothetical protein